MSTCHVPWKDPYSPPVRLSPGFEKKELSVYKLDLDAFCQFACIYCSSNTGNLMRMNSSKIEEWSESQVGTRLNPVKDADRFYISYPGIIEKLAEQIDSQPKLRTLEVTLQFGMLVDNFSPHLVQEGVTLTCLRMLFERTRFRVRALTKSNLVAKPEFIELFKRFPNRIVVGSSCGTLSNGIMEVEKYTSIPRARAAAIRTLQEAGIQTFGMFCPILPGFHAKEEIAQLYPAFNPMLLGTVWCEPYNDRLNWKRLRDHVSNKALQDAISNVMTNKRNWARYALDLARHHAETLENIGFKGKSIFLLYEAGMTPDEMAEARRIPGVLFQSDPSLNS